MFNRGELKTAAKDQLRGNWAKVGGLFLVILILMIGVQYVPFVGGLIYMLAIGAITLSMVIMSLKVYNGENLGIEDVFIGFKNWAKSLGLLIWQELFIFLWALLLIIPGIIKAYSYSMSMYVLADNPDIGIREAMNESKRITKGYKMDLFVLQLSFIGWGLLVPLTLGIGLFWFIPYVQVTQANAYKKILEASRA